MVKLYASLLVFTFATSSVLAYVLPPKPQQNAAAARHLKQLVEKSSRGDFELEKFPRREYLLDARDTVDDLEARNVLNTLTASAKFLADHHKRHPKHFKAGAELANQVSQSITTRGWEDDEDFLRRDLDAEELFGRDYNFLDERDILDYLD